MARKKTRTTEEIQQSIDNLMERVNQAQVGEAEEEAQVKEMCGLMVEFEDRQILDEIKEAFINADIPISTSPASGLPEEPMTQTPAPIPRLIATWEQVKNQLHSVSAMKRALTGERITHGDAIAIFKTDDHRKLYEAWAAAERAKPTVV